MRTILILLLACGGMAPAAWAKTLRLPKGSIEADQLRDELVVRFPAWRGTQRPDGVFINPSLRVEYTDQEIRLDVPDDADEATIQAIVAAHVPRPRNPARAGDGKEARVVLRTAETAMLEERVSEIETRLGID